MWKFLKPLLKHYLRRLLRRRRRRTDHALLLCGLPMSGGEKQPPAAAGSPCHAIGGGWMLKRHPVIAVMSQHVGDGKSITIGWETQHGLALLSPNGRHAWGTMLRFPIWAVAREMGRN